MAKIYAKLITDHALMPNGQPWELKDVPERWRSEVEKLITQE